MNKIKCCLEKHKTVLIIAQSVLAVLHMVLAGFIFATGVFIEIVIMIFGAGGAGKSIIFNSINPVYVIVQFTVPIVCTAFGCGVIAAVIKRWKEKREYEGMQIAASGIFICFDIVMLYVSLMSSLQWISVLSVISIAVFMINAWAAISEISKVEENPYLTEDIR